MSEQKLSERLLAVRGYGDIIGSSPDTVAVTRNWMNATAREVAALEAKLANYENDETPTRRELALVKRIMEQPWDDSHDRGREEAFKRLAKIRNALNLNSDPETEDVPSIDDDSRSGPHSRGTAEGNAFAAQQEQSDE